MAQTPMRAILCSTSSCSNPLLHHNFNILHFMSDCSVMVSTGKETSCVLVNKLEFEICINSCRLLDLVDTQDLSLSHVEAVALDECDKMLSLGFAQELSRLRTLLLEAPNSGVTGALHADEHCLTVMHGQPAAAAEVSPVATGDVEGGGGAPKKSKKRRKKQEGVPLQ